MAEQATLTFRNESHEFPVVVGSEGEVGVDISDLRDRTGLVTLDSGYGNTGACESAITYIDGEKGVLRYRGYPIEELAEQSTLVESSYLLIFGELPTSSQLSDFRSLLSEHQFMHEDMRHHFDGFPAKAPPMAILSAMINVAGCFQPVLMEPQDDELLMEAAARLMSQIRTIAAASHRKSIGKPINYPRSDLRYTANFLHMMFSDPYRPYEPDEEVVKALDQLLILHADHEQNCSTSTVRMVGSSRASLYASVAAGVCALWGPLHGGANQAVIRMLTEIQESGKGVRWFIDEVKAKDSQVRLMGFGHRVYKNFDPRATIIKRGCEVVLKTLGVRDPMLDIALELEAAALEDEYFVERRLYPNVDFYSGAILRAIGIPVNMFTVMFAIGRLPGWLAHWREVRTSAKPKIDRPRQIYTGPTLRPYVPVDRRGE